MSTIVMMDLQRAPGPGSNAKRCRIRFGPGNRNMCGDAGWAVRKVTISQSQLSCNCHNRWFDGQR